MYYESAIKEEQERGESIPNTSIEHAGSHIFLFRADLLEAGVKRSIGQCLVAHALDVGQITSATHALIVQGAGNTVTAVKLAVDELRLDLGVTAVIYAETSEGVRRALARKGIKVIADTPRIDGREGRSSTAKKLCESDKRRTLIEQHENPIIVDIQRRTFGQRIAETMTRPATYFVAGVGTGGTLFGIGAALLEMNPETRVVAVEGIGSTLSLWHAYRRVEQEGFDVQRAAIERALAAYHSAGMRTALECHPDRKRHEWFDIAIELPDDESDVVGIEGLGVGDPTNLIMEHLPMISEVRIVTDAQARKGVRSLDARGIRAVESAGANFFTAMKIAEELHQRGKTGRIVTVVTARRCGE